MAARPMRRSRCFARPRRGRTARSATSRPPWSRGRNSDRSPESRSIGGPIPRQILRGASSVDRSVHGGLRGRASQSSRARAHRRPDAPGTGAPKVLGLCLPQVEIGSSRSDDFCRNGAHAGEPADISEIAPLRVSVPALSSARLPTLSAWRTHHSVVPSPTPLRALPVLADLSAGGGI
jgi:hypothetical protein